jgi:hypothetical protein
LAVLGGRPVVSRVVARGLAASALRDEREVGAVAAIMRHVDSPLGLFQRRPVADDERDVLVA